MKWITFGGDLDYGYHGLSPTCGGPESWISMKDALSRVDAKMKETLILGVKKYPTRADAEKAVARELHDQKIGIKKD
jgi:hypothetical protein